MKYCDFCLNAFTCDIEPGYDSSSVCVGIAEEKYHMHFNSASQGNPPVSITVETWRDDAYYRGHKGCNVDIAKYAPKYCPECGRRIKENDEYRKLLREKRNKK